MEADHNLGEEFEEVPDQDDYVETLEFWEAKQRELVLSVIDYNLGSLLTLVSSKAIDLSPRYQRRHRWDVRRRSALIESFLMNVPVPPIFLNEDRIGRYSVIDGKQRLVSITTFLRDEYELSGLKVFARLNGSRYSQLPPDLRDALQIRANLRATIILRQSDPDVKTIVFQRLNTGGVSLNAQEVRNAAYPGLFNDLLLDLSGLPLLRHLLRIADPEKSRMYQEMRDVELVLRYFTFRNDWDTFARGVALAMDEFMKERSDNASAADISEMRSDFEQQLQAVNVAFGDLAFRRYNPEKAAWRNQVVAAVYDAEMFSVRALREQILAANRPVSADSIAALFNDEKFRFAIDAATNSVVAFRTRISMMQAVLEAEYGNA